MSKHWRSELGKIRTVVRWAEPDMTSVMADQREPVQVQTVLIRQREKYWTRVAVCRNLLADSIDYGIS